MEAQGVDNVQEKGFCKHGNFPNTCTKCHPKVVLGIEREDLSGDVQRIRDKQNVLYRQGNTEILAKYVNRLSEGSDNIVRLARERKLLEKLSATGLVPKVFGYKEYGPDRSRLLLEKIPGKSLDKMMRPERETFLQMHAQDVVCETARALQVVRDAGVYLVDVNEGTFLFEESGDEIATRLVDFELGYDTVEGTSEELHDSLSFAKSGDFAFLLAHHEKTLLPDDVTVLAKCEMHRWAKMLQSIFIRRFQKIEIPSHQQAEYEEYRTRITPVVEERIREGARASFSRMQEHQRPVDEKYVSMGEEGYITWSLKYGLASAVTQECGKFTFPHLCKANGVHLPEHVMTFIGRCLSGDLQDRPDSFRELLATK